MVSIFNDSCSILAVFLQYPEKPVKNAKNLPYSKLVVIIRFGRIAPFSSIKLFGSYNHINKFRSLCYSFQTMSKLDLPYIRVDAAFGS
jgi:hypothetical protein